MLGKGVRNALEWIQISVLQSCHAVFPGGPRVDRTPLISAIPDDPANLLVKRYNFTYQDTKKCPPKLYFHFP